MRFGPENLTEIELIALILHSGGRGESVLDLSRRLVSSIGPETVLRLRELTPTELMSHKHIGVSKACRLLAALELGKRLFTSEVTIGDKILHPADAFESLKRVFAGKTTERLYILTLDSRSRVISVDLLTVGTVNETLIHPREVFRQAIKRNAVSFILAHNHPSGDIDPSSEDIRMTQRIYNAGKELGIALVDHLIVNDAQFYSMKSNNLLFKVTSPSS